MLLVSFGKGHLARHRVFNVTSISRFVTIDKSEQSIHDVEKELFAIKRTMGKHYSNRDFKSALLTALELEERVVKIYGKKNAVYASCKNNIALMNKALGNMAAALDQYTEALQVYEDTIGKKQASYAATLANIGLLFKAEAEKSKGMEKLDLLDRADEALTDALTLRLEISGKLHKDTILSSNYVALIRATRGRYMDAEPTLVQCIADAKSLLGDVDLLVALLQNNLGFVLKQQGKFDEAMIFYQDALNTRRQLLKDDHADIIVSMHNIAELLDAQGQSEAANKLRTDIVSLLDEDLTSTESIVSSIKEEVSDIAQSSSHTATPVNTLGSTNTSVVAKSIPLLSTDDGVSAGEEGNNRRAELSMRKRRTEHLDYVPPGYIGLSPIEQQEPLDIFGLPPKL